MERVCLSCGEKLSGREDKKFCDDGCRNNYNNKKNKDVTNMMRNVNNVLRKNYRILCELNPENKTKIHIKHLQSAHFNFNYFTSTLQTKNNSVYYFVYDQGYLFIDDSWLILVKKT